jgi:folate-dependent phosphoribosylglycinamide formyltransferase PurN
VTRLLIVGDPALLMTRVLLAQFVAEARAHPEIELVALCDAGRQDRANPRNRLRRWLQQAAREIFNKGEGRLGPGLGVWEQVAKDNGVPVLTPLGRDLNARSFHEELRNRWRPDAALSLGCMQVFGPELLGVFCTAINFHNGLLPDYRGLNATPWSLYNREPKTGYSFHHMTAGIDEGPVVVDGAFAVPDGANPRAVDLAKCVAAVADARRVLDAIACRAPGRAQAGGRYYSSHDRKRICRIAEPSLLSSAEIQRRLACFGLLEIRLGNRWWEVTQLSERGAPSFATADGFLGVRRAMFLPPTLYRLYRSMRGG